MSQDQYYAGVVRKKYTLFCVAPDGAQVEISTCHDKTAADASLEATTKLLGLMAESFEMEEGFHMKVLESMESAEDVPLVSVKKQG